MPKMKTHSASKKRLSVTKSGKIKKTVANRAHKLTCKSSKRKLSLKQSAYVQSANKSAVKKLLPYS
ncbi:MAG: ribosomal protein [Clostridia bacterium]|jgi:large subunit ribosomal protein L35|nr:ribosomal protein [Clostridia bacterium]